MKDSSPVLRDMAFSLDRNSLYVMSDNQVRKRPHFGAAVRRHIELSSDVVWWEHLFAASLRVHAFDSDGSAYWRVLEWDTECAAWKFELKMLLYFKKALYGLFEFVCFIFVLHWVFIYIGQTKICTKAQNKQVILLFRDLFGFCFFGKLHMEMFQLYCTDIKLIIRAN